MLAHFIELDGDVHVPMYEKFEAELKELKARQDVKARAHHLLATYREAGAAEDISVSNPNRRLARIWGHASYGSIRLSIRLSGASAAIRRSLKP